MREQARECGVLAGAVEKLREYEIGQRAVEAPGHEIGGHATEDGWNVVEPLAA